MCNDDLLAVLFMVVSLLGCAEFFIIVRMYFEHRKAIIRLMALNRWLSPFEDWNNPDMDVYDD